MLIGVLATFALAALAPLLHAWAPRHAHWLLALLPAALAAYFATFVPEIGAGAAVRESTPWLESLGVVLSFRLDGLSLLFALLICGIGALILVYSGGYLAGDDQLGRFYLFILLFMGSMLGLVLADNVFVLFVFWELTSVTSFLLIGFDHASAQARRSALQALLVTGGGGLALLAGLILLAMAGGSFELSGIAEAGAAAAHPLYVPIAILVFAGAFTKSAQVPFHFWLPNAMDAPTPVSAYLHSATMVKAGVYLLARLNPTLGGTALWETTLIAAGAATAVLGAMLAVRHTDLKRILAYTTVASLGQMVLLIGIGTPYALKAFIVFLLAHSLYKGALFMGAGAIDHGAGTRDVRVLGGLLSAMPLTAIAVGLAAISNAGLPPFFGFIGKELIYEATLGPDARAIALTAAMVATNALLLVTAGLVFVKPFFGARRETLEAPHEGSVALWAPPLLLGLVGLAFGIANALPASWFVGAGALAVGGIAVDATLGLWHGFNLALLTSAVTVAVGALLFVGWPQLKETLDRFDSRINVSPERGYDRALAGMLRLAAWQNRVLQHGYLRLYLLVIFAIGTAAIVVTMAAREVAIPLAVPDAPYEGWVLTGLVIASTLAAVFATSRLTAILALGVLGFTSALLFLVFGAPDVAITQFMVETLIVIIVALVLVRLPPLTRFQRTGRWERVRDGTVAIASGAAITAVMLAVMALPFDPWISEYYMARSVPEAHGRNVVNVILVDFRALDTLGEIVVVAISGLGAFALLKGRAEPVPPRKAASIYSLILSTTTRLLVSLMLIFSIFILFRGHNEPGGGFIGGLIATSAFALHSLAYGPKRLRELLAVDPKAIAGLGLVTALTAGVAAALAGKPFLTGLWLMLGGAGADKGFALGTPLLFDLGVYLVVLGAVLAVVLALEEEEHA